MAKFNVVDMNGQHVSEIELSDAVFGITPNEKAVHEAVVNFLANQRQGTQSTLTRAEVRGGGIKPWRQKGTGRARAGSNRSPVWRGGAILFGPQPRKYDFKVNKKIRKLALRMALSSRLAGDNLLVVKGFDLPEAKTKVFAKIAGNLGLS